MRGGAVIPARHLDSSEHGDCIAVAASQTDAAIVLDTTAAAVLNILPGPLRDVAFGLFSRVTMTDTAALDALAAKDSFAWRSPGSLVYDEQRGAHSFEPTSDDETQRYAREAAELFALTQRLERLPRRTPPLFFLRTLARSSRGYLLPIWR